MKIVFLLLYLLPIVCMSQQQPVEVSVSKLKISEHQYRVQFQFSIQKGWYVYAKGDALQINVLSDDFMLVDRGSSKTSSSEPNRQTMVYRHHFTIWKTVFINGTIPPVMQFSIQGFAANTTEVIPIDMTVALEIEGQKVLGGFKNPWVKPYGD